MNDLKYYSRYVFGEGTTLYIVISSKMSLSTTVMIRTI